MKLPLVAPFLLACAANCSPLGQTLLTPASEPCKQVQHTVEAWRAANIDIPWDIEIPGSDIPKDLYQYFVPPHPAVPIKPSLAYACLQSIPLDKDTAIKHIEWLRSFAVWHSTTNHLKNPPQGFLSEGVDLLGGLDDIEDKLKTAAYQNEFEFLVDVYTLGDVRVRDIHFSWMPQLLDLFTFRRGVEFASVSKDRTSLPEIYLYDDIKNYHPQNPPPSPVTTIDNLPAATYLQRLSLLTTGTHDPDARYNLLFHHPTKDTNTLSPSAGGPSYLVPPFLLPDTTSILLRNGTALTFPNHALLRADLSNTTTAASLYTEFGRATTAPNNPWLVLPWSAHDLLVKNYTRPFTGYPSPVAATPDGQLAGFLPPSPSLSDVAVLDVRSFSTTPSPYHFRDFDRGYEARFNASVALIRAAKAAGRKKLIIDLQGNGGGQYINLAALYVTLFPGPTLPLLWRHRAHPVLAAIVDEADRLAAKGARYTDVLKLFPFNVGNYLRPNGTKWGSFAEWYGNGTGGETHASAYNLSTALFPGLEYQHKQPWGEAPYRPEDVVVLLDGVCASACAIFTEALVHGHGVMTVAVGGRPVEAPMQGVGQVKQGTLLAFPVEMGPLGKNLTLPDGLTVPVTFPPLISAGAVVNEANMVPLDDPEGLPLEVMYEAANCRLFYSFESMVDVEKLWEQVADVAWNRGKCVHGSTTRKDSRMGGVPEYTPAVEDQYKLGEGVGSI